MCHVLVCSNDNEEVSDDAGRSAAKSQRLKKRLVESDDDTDSG